MAIPTPLAYLDFLARQYFVNNKVVPESDVVFDLYGASLTFGGDGIFAPIPSSGGGGGLGPWVGTNSPALQGEALAIVNDVIQNTENMIFVEYTIIPSPGFIDGVIAFGPRVFVSGNPPGSGNIASLEDGVVGTTQVQPVYVVNNGSGGLGLGPASLNPVDEPIIAVMNFEFDGVNYIGNMAINGSALFTSSTITNPFISPANYFALGNSGDDPTLAGVAPSWGTGAIRRIAVYSTTDFPPPTFPGGSSPGGFPPPPRPLNNSTGILSPSMPVPLPCIPCCRTACPCEDAPQ
jgi:hypothetical protein